jgi:hypothetical protein
MDIRVVDLRLTICMLLDRKLFPWASQIEHFEGVIDQLVPTELPIWPGFDFRDNVFSRV